MSRIDLIPVSFSPSGLVTKKKSLRVSDSRATSEALGVAARPAATGTEGLFSQKKLNARVEVRPQALGERKAPRNSV